jgi:hypothetical protein
MLGTRMQNIALKIYEGVQGMKRDNVAWTVSERCPLQDPVRVDRKLHNRRFAIAGGGGGGGGGDAPSITFSPHHIQHTLSMPYYIFIACNNPTTN